MSANSLTLTWTAATGTAPISYQPQFRRTGDTAWTAYGSPIANLTIAIGGLIASTSYDFEITASNSFGSATSSIVTGITGSGNAFPASGSVAGTQNTGTADPVIAGPQNGAVLTSTALSVTGITITDAATGTGTLLVRCAGGTVAMTLNGAVPGSGTASITLTDTLAHGQSAVGTLAYTGPSAATTDTVSVQFTDQNSATNTLLIPIQVNTGAPAVAPGAPGNLVASAATNVSMQLTWTASTGTQPITYQPLYKLHTDTSYITSGSPVSGLTATVTGLTQNQSYDFEVSASNSAGSATSTVVTASTTNAAVAPSAPTNLQVQANTSSTLTYSWSPPATGSAPITYQPQYRKSGSPVLTNWYDNPGQDGAFWKQPFASTATWIVSGSLITALRGGTPSINQKGNYAAPFYVGRATDPDVTVTDGTHSITVKVPLGAIVETPSAQFDNTLGGLDTTRPYLLWSISGATINGTGAVAASGSVITGTYGFAVQDGTGLLMVDIVTGAPGDNNSFGLIQDHDLSQIAADPNYIMQHMLTYQLDPSFQCSGAGPVWPLKVIDTSHTNSGPIPQGCTVGIPANVARPTGKSRGFYALWDCMQQFGGFFYNVGSTGGINISVYDSQNAYTSLVSDLVASWPAVAAQLCILDPGTAPNYTSGGAGAQFSLATTKGATSGSVPAFPPPPLLDLSPTGGHTVAPSTFGAWYPSGYNVTPPFTAATGTGPFINFGSPISATSVTITGLQVSTSYDLDVVAINANGTATSAAITSSTGLTGIPSDTTGLQARPAQDLLNRFGINTHFGNGLYTAYTSAQGVAAVQLIGCTLIRDSDNG